MIYVIAGLVILAGIEGAVLFQYSVMLHTVRERLLRQIKINMALKHKLTEMKPIRSDEIAKIYRERTMTVDMTEVKHD